MKKYFILAIFGVFMLTGCDIGTTKTMSCTYKNTSGNLTSKMTYKIDHQGNDVKKVRISYDYHMDENTEMNNTGTNNSTNDNSSNNNNTNQMDGIGTGTDGTTNDTQADNDGIIDGVVGSAIDSVIKGVTDTILDISGLRDRHANVQNMYGNINGFSVQNTSDTTDNNYHVTYVIDFDTISDNDLNTLNLSKDFDTLKRNYTSQGFTCDE